MILAKTKQSIRSLVQISWEVHVFLITLQWRHRDIMASQSIGNSTVCSTVCAGYENCEYQIFALFTLCEGKRIQRLPIDSHHKGPFMRFALPCQDVSWNDWCQLQVEWQQSDANPAVRCQDGEWMPSEQNMWTLTRMELNKLRYRATHQYQHKI